MNTTTLQNVPEYLTRPFEKNNLTGPEFLSSVRTTALARFEELGIPTTKNEEWKYTNISHLSNSDFNFSQEEFLLNENEIARNLLAGKDVILFVFENGRLNKQLSSFSQLPAGIIAGNIPDHYNHPAVIEHLAKHASLDNEAMIALNTAYLNEGAFIYLDDKIECEKIIHLLYMNSGKENTMAFPRNLLVAGKNARVKVVESFHSSDKNQQAFINAVTEIVLEKNASAEWTKIQSENNQAYHINHTEVLQSSGSVFDIHTITTGGKIVRNNLHIVLDGEHVTSNLNGLSIGAGDSIIDNHTLVDHARPDCNSNELYKSVLDGKSKGVFNGKIFVRRDAQKTNAYQSNKNLLLSDFATMNTKPQLEIYADDVKCSHGATIGQLDNEALFYLRSRGIGLENARAFLTIAFAEDVLNRITGETLNNNLKNLIREKLSKGNS